MIYSLPEVVSEIKDKNTRERLAVLPFALNFVNPPPDAIKTGKPLHCSGSGQKFVARAKSTNYIFSSIILGPSGIRRAIKRSGFVQEDLLRTRLVFYPDCMS